METRGGPATERGRRAVYCHAPHVWPQRTDLVGFDAGAAYHVGPYTEFTSDQRVELRRRAANRLGAQLLETPHHLRRLQRLARGRVEAIDNRLRRAGRSA